MKERPLFPIYDILEHWAAFAFTTPEVRPVHHALYHALVYMCKRRGGAHRFNLPTQEGMQACGIAARNTYTAALRDLEGWGFVVYTPGANGIIAPIVDVKFCAGTEQALSSYRSSHYATGDASTEHIIKEVKRLKEEDDEKSGIIKNLEKQLADSKTEISDLQADLDVLREEVAAAAGLPSPAAPAAPVDPAKAAARATTNPDDEILWSDSPLSRPESFKIMCCRHPLGKPIAHEYYRQVALALAESKQVSRTILQWESWIFKFLENQKPKNGQLLTPVDVAADQQTGVRAPQHPDAPNHKPRPEVAAKRAADFEAQKQVRIAANLARNAADGLSQQPQPGGIARGF